MMALIFQGFKKCNERNTTIEMNIMIFFPLDG